MSTALLVQCQFAQANDYAAHFRRPNRSEQSIINSVKRDDNSFFPNSNPECADRAFSKNHEEDCGLKIEWFVIQVHLDKSADPELIILGRGLQYCGAGNCPIEIYKKKANKWRKIMEDSNASDTMMIYDHMTNGFHDIRQSSDSHKLTFDGKEYVCQECN